MPRTHSDTLSQGRKDLLAGSETQTSQLPVVVEVLEGTGERVVREVVKRNEH